MKKGLILFILALLVVSVSVFAQVKAAKEIEVKVDKVKWAITGNDFAEFELTISNNLNKDIDFFIAKNFYGERWRVTSDPYILSVGAGFSKSARLNIQPTGFLLPANYKLIVVVESRDKSYSKEIPIEVEIVPFGEESVRTELTIDRKIDPRIGGAARVSLENLYNFDIDNVKLIFDSDLFSFGRELKLEANEKRVERFQLEFDDDVKLGEYVFNVAVKTGKYVLGTATEKVALSPYTEVTETIFRSNKFNKKIIITKENTGSEETDQEIKLELSTVERVSARFNVEPDSIEKINGKYLAIWGFSLEPGDSKDVVVTLPYGTYLLLLLVIALFVYIIFYLTRMKVKIVKKVIDVTKDKEGIRGVKIILHLTNKGNRAIERIRIIDYMPRLVAASSQDFGTMRPTRVQRSSDGRMRLVWDLDGLRRGEERILSYIARSRLSIIGRLLLPEAVVEYQIGNKHYHKRSNKLTLLMKTSERERRN